MLFTNGRVLLPDGIQDGVNVRVIESVIVEIGTIASLSADEVIDLEGNYLAPGFIDLHLHGALGRDTMEASVDAFTAIRDYHASGGTTSFLPTTVTAPIAEIVRVLGAIEKAAASLPQILGAHVEGPFISRLRHGAQRTEFVRDPEPALVSELLAAAGPIKRMTFAPELHGTLELIEQLSDRGIRNSGGHSDAWDNEARLAFEKGMRQVTHTFNCMSSMRRRDSQRVAGLLEFALSQPEIVCELIADGHHVSPTLMRMLYRAKGAEGICLVTDSIAGAGLREGTTFSLYGNECVVADGACWLADRSALAGSASRMIDLVRTIMREVGVPFLEAIQMATETPARAMGWALQRGRIAEGMDADFVVLSPELEVRRTFSRGRQIFPLG